MKNVRKINGGNKPKKVRRLSSIDRLTSQIPSIKKESSIDNLDDLDFPEGLDSLDGLDFLDDLDDPERLNEKPKAKRPVQPSGVRETSRGSHRSPLMRNIRPIAEFARRHKRQRNAARKRLKPPQRATLKADLLSSTSPLTRGDPLEKGFWGCTTRKRVAKHRAKLDANFKRKVMKALDRSKCSAEIRRIVEGLFDGTATSSPIVINFTVLTTAVQVLLDYLTAAIADDPDIEIAFVTFILGNGGSSLDEPFIELVESQKKVAAACRDMAQDFFGVTELAFFNSIKHPRGGRHLQRHEHVLVWGPNAVAQAEAVAERRMKTFPPNVTNAPQIDVRRVDKDPVNLARVVSYMLKSPDKAMNWVPPRDGKRGFMNHSEASDRMINYLRLALVRASLTIEDMTFAGGSDGCRVRKNIIKKAETDCSVATPPSRRLLHPDGVAAFCAQLGYHLGKRLMPPIVVRKA